MWKKLNHIVKCYLEWIITVHNHYARLLYISTLRKRNYQYLYTKFVKYLAFHQHVFDRLTGNCSIYHTSNIFSCKKHATWSDCSHRVNTNTLLYHKTNEHVMSLSLAFFPIIYITTKNHLYMVKCDMTRLNAYERDMMLYDAYKRFLIAYKRFWSRPNH